MTADVCRITAGEGFLTPHSLWSNLVPHPFPKSSYHASGPWRQPLLGTSPWIRAVSASDGGTASARWEGGDGKRVTPHEHLLRPGTYGVFISLCGGTSIFLTFCHPSIVRGGCDWLWGQLLPLSCLLGGRHKGPRPLPESHPSSIRQAQHARRGDGYLGSGYQGTGTRNLRPFFSFFF